MKPDGEFSEMVTIIHDNYYTLNSKFNFLIMSKRCETKLIDLKYFGMALLTAEGNDHQNKFQLIYFYKKNVTTQYI